MQTYKKRIIYIMQSAVLGFLYFLLSYRLIFQNIAEGDVFIATIWNIAFIFVILISERIEVYIAIRVGEKIRKKKPNILSKILDAYYKEASLKSALYCFYIVLIVCVALLAADPDFAPLSDMSDYFLSVRYGILALIAVDKFMEQVFKDLKSQDDLCNQSKGGQK